jgi:hypothetical protein
MYYVVRHDILIDATTMPILRPSRFLRPDETSKSVRGTGDRQGRNAYRWLRVRAVRCDLDLRDLEVFADFAGKKLVDLAVARNRSRFPLSTVDIHGMFCTFAMKRASVLFEMPDQVKALDCFANTNGSRITS